MTRREGEHQSGPKGLGYRTTESGLHLEGCRELPRDLGMGATRPAWNCGNGHSGYHGKDESKGTRTEGGRAVSASRNNQAGDPDSDSRGKDRSGLMWDTNERSGWLVSQSSKHEGQMTTALKAECPGKRLSLSRDARCEPSGCASPLDHDDD